MAVVLEHRADVLARVAGRRRGREALNFSEWDREQELEDLVEVVEEGEMPPVTYRILHSGARLSDAERARLIQALDRVDGSGGDSSGHGPGGD